MEKKNQVKINGKSMAIQSTTMRIPDNQKQKIKMIGEGDFRQGLTKVLTIYDTTMRDPEKILMNDVDLLMDDLKKHYGENHYKHFDNFPAFFKMFLKKGHTNVEILKQRPEQSIEKFEKKEADDAKDPI